MTEQACPGTGPVLAGRFRQHLHAVACSGDTGEPRVAHMVRYARCEPHGHVCPGCARDWDAVSPRYRRTDLELNDHTTGAAIDAPAASAARIKAALDAANARRRDRQAARTQEGHH